MLPAVWTRLRPLYSSLKISFSIVLANVASIRLERKTTVIERVARQN